MNNVFPGKTIKAEIWALDGTREAGLVSEEYFTSDRFTIYLHLNLHGVYLIRIKAEQ